MSSHLRIAQLANFVSPRSGGMKTALRHLNEGYLAHGAHVLTVLPSKRSRITHRDNLVTVEVASPKVSDTYRVVTNIRAVKTALAQFQPTSVEVSDKWTLSAIGSWARHNNIGSVLFSHERLEDMARGWLPFSWGVKETVHWRNRRLAKLFDRVIVTSAYSAQEWRNTQADLRLVPLGVDLEQFHPAVGAPRPGRPRLCYVGRMSHEKHPQLAVAGFVRAVAQGFDGELHMFGSGPDEGRLKQLAGDAPVIFHGYLTDRAAVARAYAESTMSLSVSPMETFGLAVLEALACGTPVVTSNRGGASELVTSACGELSEPTPQGVADAIVRLSQRDDAVRVAAREQAEKYSWDATVANMLDVHERLASQR